MVKGYYSVIQYNPDPSRAEAANVGVVLFCPGDEPLILAKRSEKLSRVKMFFRPEVDKLWRIADAVNANITRLTLKKSEYRSVEEFEQFVRTLANDIKMTLPRVVAVTDAVVDLERLFIELVEMPVAESLRTAEVLPTAINEVFVELARQNKVKRPGRIVVPVINRRINVPYAYRNGALNLVKPTTISQSVNVDDGIIRLAMEGDLINRNKVDGEERKLIVVSAASNRAEDEKRVAPLFREYRVLFVPQNDAIAFADRIRSEAR